MPRIWAKVPYDPRIYSAIALRCLPSKSDQLQVLTIFALAKQTKKVHFLSALSPHCFVNGEVRHEKKSPSCRFSFYFPSSTAKVRKASRSDLSWACS
jgi:hypothetical protein